MLIACAVPASGLNRYGLEAAPPHATGEAAFSCGAVLACDVLTHERTQSPNDGKHSLQ